MLDSSRMVHRHQQYDSHTLPFQRLSNLLGVRTLRRLSLALVLLVSFGALVSACGGGDDDDSSPFGSGGSSDDDSADNGAGDDSGNSSPGDMSVDIPDLADGGLGGGSVHLKISGDFDKEYDYGDGTGIVISGFANFVFSDDTSTVNFVLAGDDQPGAVSISTGDIVTGGGFGSECSVSVDESESKVTGEFSCKNVAGLKPGSTKAYDKLQIEGTFTIDRTE